MFCYTLLYVHSSIAIILMGKRELVALLNLSSWCPVVVGRLFLAVPWGCLRFVIVEFSYHTHLVFWTISLKKGPNYIVDITSAAYAFCQSWAVRTVESKISSAFSTMSGFPCGGTRLSTKGSELWLFVMDWQRAFNTSGHTLEKTESS